MTTQVESRAQNVEDVDTASPVEELKRLLPEEQVERILRALDHEPDPIEARYGRPLPVQLITRYAMLATWRAEAERLDDGSWYADINGFPGVWAQGDSEQEALKNVEAVVRDWVLLKIMDRDRDLPIIDEIDLNVL